MQDPSHVRQSLASTFTHENTDGMLVFEMLWTWVDGVGWMATSKVPGDVPFGEVTNTIYISKD